jgi:hypothetical protein
VKTLKPENELSLLSSGGSGNSLLGTSSSTSTESDFPDLAKTDTYADGSDTQYIGGTSSSVATTTSNSITGDYDQSNTGTSSITTNEHGTRSGVGYSLIDYKKSNTFSDKHGNSLTGDYTLNSSSTDTETDNRVEAGVMSVYQQTDAAGASTTTGNDLTGVYTTTSGGTTTVTSDDMVGSDVFVQINTTVSNLTQTGNSISGSFTSVDNPVLTTNITQTGDDASGSFTLLENSTDNPIVTTTGNTISGQQTILTTNGSQTYNFTQTQSGYTLTGGGTKTYSSTETDSVTTGMASSTETGTDSYTLGESGSAVDTQSLTGSDGYTTTRTQNSLDGSFSIVTTGTGSNSYTVTQTGNTFAGTASLSQTGATRYDQLQAYDNTADSATGNVGMADFSPVGLPVLVGRASVTAGTFSTIGNAQFEYCFAAGTRVVMADLTRKAIEAIVENDQVLATPDCEPTGRRRACRVKAVYHNRPAPLWHVNVAGQTIRTTFEHPFFVEGKGWTKVKDLFPGDCLCTDSGEWVKVESVEDSGKIEPVFNLQVEDCHTYFVSTSDADVAVLVHNDSVGSNSQAIDSAQSCVRCHTPPAPLALPNLTVTGSGTDSNGFYAIRNGRKSYPVVICHGRDANGPIPGLSATDNYLGGTWVRSGSPGDILQNICAGTSSALVNLAIQTSIQTTPAIKIVGVNEQLADKLSTATAKAMQSNSPRVVNSRMVSSGYDFGLVLPMLVDPAALFGAGALDEVGVLKAGRIPSTGVAALDAPAVSSSSFAQKIGSIRRAGFSVVEDSTLAARAEFAEGSFTYNPDTMSRLDFAHEWQHYKQISQLRQRGIPWNGKTIKTVEAPAEVGAYGYEQQLWERAGFSPSDEYLEWHTNKLASYDDGMWKFRSLTAKPYGAKYRSVDW